MKKYTIHFFLLLLLITYLFSCNKSNTITPIKFQSELLAGTGTIQDSFHIWQLDSTYINGVNQFLTYSQKQFKTTYTVSGKYYDTDNNIGKWEISNLNQLKTMISYNLIDRLDNTNYDIIQLNAVKLKLKLNLTNGQILIHVYKKV